MGVGRWAVTENGRAIAGASALDAGERFVLTLQCEGARWDAVQQLLTTICRDIDGAIELTQTVTDPFVDESVLVGLGFEPGEVLVGVERSLAGVREPADAGGIGLIPLTRLRDREIETLFATITGRPEEAHSEWHRLICEAGRTLRFHRWFAVEHDRELVGLLLPTLDPVDRRLGWLSFVGLVPRARGQGLGTPLHQLGLVLLRRRGARRYEDTTERANLPMRAIFRSNGCVETGRCRTWLRPG